MPGSTVEPDAVTPTTPDELRAIPKPPARWLAVLTVVAAVVVLLLWSVGTPAGVMGKINAVGYAICHQIAAHSFLIDGVPMPLCARCTGIYLGVMTGLAILIVSGRRRVRRMPPINIMIVLGLFVALMGIDGVNSYATLIPGLPHLYEPNNTLRLFSGLLCGLALITIVFPVFNDVAWQQPDNGRSVETLRELGGMVLIVAFVGLLLLSDRPTFMLILGVISTIGVIVMLSLIGTVLYISLFRLQNSLLAWRGLLLPALGGLTVAFMLIGGIDAVRLLLTHTWAGFAIGG